MVEDSAPHQLITVIRVHLLPIREPITLDLETQTLLHHLEVQALQMILTAVLMIQTDSTSQVMTCLSRKENFTWLSKNSAWDAKKSAISQRIKSRKSTIKILNCLNGSSTPTEKSFRVV